ncbi:hypothetical protein D3C71_1865460 [compost metagenome]
MVREGYQLNHPVSAVPAPARKGALPSTGSILALSDGHTVLDTLKVAEDGTGMMFRLYESSGGREAAFIRLDVGELLSAGETALSETDLAEKATGRLIPIRDGVAAFSINPYEVLTFKLGADQVR